jgi:TPR repeat protein
MIFHNAEGIERDPEAAAAWFEKAARLGDVESQAMLGAAYHMGLGVRQDQVLAYRWLARAQRRGNEVAAGFLLRVRPLLSEGEREEAERLIASGDGA